MNITGETGICASLANPNKKTTAPLMHNAGFDKIGVNMWYVAFEPDNIEKAMQAVRSLGLIGVSISKPFKEEVIQYLDEVDEVAQKIGAVNVVHNTNGILKGYNSDWIGAIGALEEQTVLQGKNVAVLGAGGAARAIVYGLTKRGANVFIFNRSSQKGTQLAKEFGAIWGGGLEKVSDFDVDILINATPVGRQDTTLSPVSAETTKGISVVMDINVQKQKSQLRIDAENNGAKTIGGDRMLVLQGVLPFELFSGKKAPVEIMHQAILDAM